MMAPTRPPEQEGAAERPPFTPVRAMAWMLGSFLVMVVCALVYFAIDETATSDLVGLGIVSSAAFLFMSALLIGRYPGGPRLSQPLGVRASHPLAIILGLVAGLSAKVPAEQFSYWIERAFPISPEEEARIAGMFEAESTLHGVAMFVVIAVLVPVAEEVFFRGAVYGAMRRSHVARLPAAAATALGFTFCHADIRQLLPIFLVAVVLGALRSYSGSLLPGILAHVAFNGTAILGATFRLFPQVDELSLTVKLGSAITLVVALGLLVTLVARDSRARLACRLETQVAADESVGNAHG